MQISHADAFSRANNISYYMSADRLEHSTKVGVLFPRAHADEYPLRKFRNWYVFRNRPCRSEIFEANNFDRLLETI